MSAGTFPLPTLFGVQSSSSSLDEVNRPSGPVLRLPGWCRAGQLMFIPQFPSSTGCNQFRGPICTVLLTAISRLQTSSSSTVRHPPPPPLPHVHVSPVPSRPVAALEIGVSLRLSTAQPTFHGDPPSLPIKVVSFKPPSVPFVRGVKVSSLRKATSCQPLVRHATTKKLSSMLLASL